MYSLLANSHRSHNLLNLSNAACWIPPRMASPQSPTCRRRDDVISGCDDVAAPIMTLLGSDADVETKRKMIGEMIDRLQAISYQLEAHRNVGI